MSDFIPLPEPSSNQPTIQLSRLEGGYLHLPSDLFMTPNTTNTTHFRVPDMCWLLRHPSGKSMVFDLGMRKDIENFTPGVYKRLQELIKSEIPEDVFDSLRAGGVDPQKDIDLCLLSHIHYDHCGDPSKFGPNTQFMVGPGAGKLLWGENAYPVDKHSHFDSKLLPRDRAKELPIPGEAPEGYWKPLGPFPEAHDFFGDSSVFIVNAPGHLPGHVNLLVRERSGGWIYLAGDTAHHSDLLDGKAEVSTYTDAATGCLKCAHSDKEAAETHIKRVRRLRDEGGVEIILHHDMNWFEKNKNRFPVSS
ncbi:Metallo-hydrolase/oxidoreductase [Rhizodiscina lignyota]|uniref:Metallo-hydrolase/oxidoreductase n=1 Tax=Rhizodiscina lignyota TaxID=1504668 RepID=A0A9P4ID43_9PEZI|nr:Metallo-hydrolase/oxidoreductase [Rhizodiscina lignyota]